MTRPRGTVLMTGQPSPTEDKGTGRFECPICLTRYPSVGDKKRHMKESHK